MSKTMQDAYIVAATRLPVGKRNGMYATVRPDDMLAAVLRGALAQAPGLDANRIEDVVAGCAMPEAEQGMNVARIGVLLAGGHRPTPRQRRAGDRTGRWSGHERGVVEHVGELVGEAGCCRDATRVRDRDRVIHLLAGHHDGAARRVGRLGDRVVARHRGHMVLHLAAGRRPDRRRIGDRAGVQAEPGVRRGHAVGDGRP